MCVCVYMFVSQVPVGPPSEVEEIFDAISYSKGSCVIRMLHDWIGVEVCVCVCVFARVCVVTIMSVILMYGTSFSFFIRTSVLEWEVI